MLAHGPDQAATFLPAHRVVAALARLGAKPAIHAPDCLVSRYEVYDPGDSFPWCTCWRKP